MRKPASLLLGVDAAVAVVVEEAGAGVGDGAGEGEGAGAGAGAVAMLPAKRFWKEKAIPFGVVFAGAASVWFGD